MISQPIAAPALGDDPSDSNDLRGFRDRDVVDREQPRSAVRQALRDQPQLATRERFPDRVSPHSLGDLGVRVARVGAGRGGRQPPETQSGPGGGGVLLGVRGVLLAAGCEHDIRPNGLRLLLADPCDLFEVPRDWSYGSSRPLHSVSDVHVAGRDVATAVDDGSIRRPVQMLVTRASSC